MWFCLSPVRKPLTSDPAQADIESHIAALKVDDDVEEIRLGGNTLGVEACKALAEVLKTKKNLQIFNAADIFTGRLISEIPDALTALLTALLTLPKLHTVDLSDNAFGGRLAEPLKDFYSKAGPLRHLLLNNNGLGPAGGSIVANAIKDLAAVKSADPSLPPLETIVCGRNRLEDGSMHAWSAAYAAHKTLKIVNMVQNGIRPTGINKLLRNGLSHCAELVHLDLQDNTFTLEGAQALASVVTGWSKIEALCVGDCLLSARGGVLLGEALNLQKTPELKKLSLQYNEIDIKGAQAIHTAILNSLPNLEVLELNGNKFSEEDPLVDEIRELFSDRGFGGLDSLSDMEEESDEEEEDEEFDEEEEEEEEHEEEEQEEKAERVLKEADHAQAQNGPQEKDKKVEDLAELLGTTKISA
ncbi:hypothetical protein FN846DRAFT_785153 [Sphaerosporella brunnea]|uniref:Ran GTPase activating protein 1 n=1 Tax=Sphaerosporella brunnea TaxID=1250544 RepID=A0A5J5EJY2_9PEZI|nr:hypothetical protein FN846DRAFT_785153 [Sphaerosporella brunnea]